MQSAVGRRLAVILAVLALSGCAARLAYHQGLDEGKKGNWDMGWRA